MSRLEHLSYLAVLLGCLLATAPLEILLRTRVYARPRRLALTVAPVLVVFVGWDLYAIARGHWDFDPRRTTGIVLPGGIPLDEVLFFLVVPVCAILALEAVRSVTGWRAGDEPPPAAGVTDTAGAPGAAGPSGAAGPFGTAEAPGVAEASGASEAGASEAGASDAAERGPAGTGG